MPMFDHLSGNVMSLTVAPMMKGYTSLGSSHNVNTNPNPVLKYEDGSHRYKPSYMLEDGSFERG